MEQARTQPHRIALITTNCCSAQGNKKKSRSTPTGRNRSFLSFKQWTRTKAGEVASLRQRFRVYLLPLPKISDTRNQNKGKHG